MLPATTGARPGKINMMFSPNSANPRLFPERKPSPRPTKRSNDPTPQATPNMVRNERSLCAHSVRKICAKISRIIRMTTVIVHLTISQKIRFEDQTETVGGRRIGGASMGPAVKKAPLGPPTHGGSTEYPV